jgi:uncharacterized protein (DUF433 family)
MIDRDGATTMTFERITSDPERLNGQPCIRNTRLTVQRLIKLLALYPNRDELFSEYPNLEEADIQQALLYVATYLDDTIVSLPTRYETVA